MHTMRITFLTLSKDLIVVAFIVTISIKYCCSINEQVCLDESKFQSCRADITSLNLYWNLYTSHDLYFRILSPGYCVSYGFIYKWELKTLANDRLIQKFDKFNNRAVLTIRHGVLPPKEYKMEVTIKGTRKNLRKLVCWFRIRAAEPAPVIAGGPLRNAMDGDEITLDGRATDEAGVMKLKYKWQCLTRPLRRPCTKLSSKEKATRITISGNVGQVYKIILTVFATGILKTTTQLINIVEKSLPLISISCEKNCLGKGHIETNPAQVLFLKARCLKNCDGITYEWTVSNGILEEDTLYGFYDPRLMIDTYVMEFDEDYEMEVRAIRNGKPTEATAKWTLRTASVPDKSCTVKPSSGTSLKTLFQVECSGGKEKRPITYIVDQLYKKSPEDSFTGVFLTQDSVPLLATLLAPVETTGELMVFARDDKYTSVNIPLNVKVKPLLAHLPDEEIMKEIMKIYSGQTDIIPSVRVMARHGWSDRAVQIVNCLFWELENIRNEGLLHEFGQKFKYKVLADFLLFPPDANMKGLASMVPLLIDRTKPKRAHYAVMLSKLCKRVSGSVREYMANAKHPMLSFRTSQRLTSILIDCADFLLDGDFQKRRGYDITTELPSDIHKVIEEDYPNYKDVIDSQLRERYVDITNNAMQIIRECTYTFSTGLAYGQSVSVGETNKIFMQLGNLDEVQLNFSSDPGVSITLPKNLGLDQDENFRILFISFKDDIYFWDSVGQNISTRIVELDIYNEKNQLLTRLPDHIDAYMDLVDQKKTAIQVKGKAEVASGGWTEKDITVYRVNTFKKSQFFVDISDIGAGGIEVVITQGRRPRLEDFKDARKFKNRGNLQFPILDYDAWCYLGILPSRSPVSQMSRSWPLISNLRSLWNMVLADKSKTQATDFKYTFTTQSCLEWSGNSWKGKNCTLGHHTTASKIHCRCTSLAKVSGVTYTPKSKLDNFNELDYELQFVYTYLIFAMTAAVLLCYFIAMSFIIFRIRPATELYFLSDNVKDERYAYLMIVKTGKANHAGTSSNVMVKLHGEKRSSKVHVLNYPDPNRRLLQHMNEDWFVLTTSMHLGELPSIELWFDSIGNRPRWYCEWIRICDLQLEKWWFFDVQRWFTVSKPNQNFYKIDSTAAKEKKDTKKRGRYFLKSNDFNLTFLERITIILSNILLTYTLGLLICVTPEMRLRDGFAKPILNSYLDVIGCAVAISLLSSGVHSLFVFAFRNSSRKRGSEYTRALLPNWTIKLAWNILIVCAMLETVYLAMFGFWASDTAAMIWFMMTTVAILISIFIWENVYIVIAAIFEKETDGDLKYDYRKIIYETEQQRKGLYQFAGFYGLRPYLTHLYKPLDKKRILRKQELLQDRIILSKAFRDMLIFALYMFFLFVLVYENTDTMSVLHNNHVRDLMEAEHLETPLEDVGSKDDAYEYLNNSLIPTLHAVNWYGNWTVMESGLMSDFSTKVLGVARIRQKRVQITTCMGADFSHSLLNVTRCRPELTSETADQRSYGGKITMWTYVPPLVAGVTLTYGFIRTYTGGGYITTLGRNINNAYYIIDRLLLYKWIDAQTRVLIVEFWTYNANSNLFNAVKVVIECSATQLHTTSTEIYTNRLMHVDVKHEIIPVITFSIFMIIVFYQLCNCIAAVVNERLSFFKRFWNVVDLTILIMSISIVSLTIHKMQLVIDLLELLNKTKRNKFINYYPVLYYDKLLTLMSALLICIATFRTWKYLRFAVMFKVFERTFVKQLKPLLAVFIYNMITLFMFSLYGFMTFSTFSVDFRNLGVTFTTMVLLSLNLKSGENLDIAILQQYASSTGSIFYVSFTLVMLLIINVYITIIIIYYEESLEHFTEAELKYSVLDYARDEFKYLSRYFSRYIKSLRLKSGEDSSETIRPKNHKYTNSHVMEDADIIKMSGLAAGITHNFLFRTNKNKLEERDYRIMAKIAGLTLRGSKSNRKHIFFLSEGDKDVKMIPDDRLLEMEKIVRKIFGEKMVKKPLKYQIDNVTLKKLENHHKLLNIINRIVGNINIVNVRRR